MAWADLSQRCKFSLTGPDRVRYLNGQVTNNVARLSAGQSCQALVCNHKGKLEGEVFIHATDDTLWIDGPGELREALGVRLAKYLIADDCELTDVTDDWHIFHALDLPDSEASDPAGEKAMVFRKVSRLGPDGVDLWIPAGQPGPRTGLSPAQCETLRLEWGVPAWGSELTPDVLPQEAQLEARAVDFAKGCYVGQEVVSRLRSVGHVNRLLQPLEVVAGGLSVTARDRIFSEEPPGQTASHETPRTGWKEVGFLTSVGPDATGQKTIALGYVRRTVPLDTAVLRVGRSIDDLTGTVRLRQPHGPQRLSTP